MHIQIGRDLERQPRFLQAEQESDRIRYGRDILPRSPGHRRSQPQALQDAQQTKQIKYDQWASRFSTWLAVC